jgi:hypothetical protein
MLLLTEIKLGLGGLMNKNWAIAGLLVSALLIFGCAGSSNQYSPSKAGELSNTGTPEQNNPTLVHRYSSLIGTSFVDPEQGDSISIKGFDVTYKAEQDVNEAHILFLVENTGKKAVTGYCSFFTLLDDKGREFELQEDFSRYFGKDVEGDIQPGLSIIMDCSQIFPKDAVLKSLEIKYSLSEPTVVANLLATSSKAPPQPNNTPSSASGPTQSVPDPYSKYYGKTATIQDTLIIRLDNISESPIDPNGKKSIQITFSVLNNGDNWNTLLRMIYFKDQNGTYYKQNPSCGFAGISPGINDTETCLFLQVPPSSEPVEVVTTSLGGNDYTPLFRLQ